MKHLFYTDIRIPWAQGASRRGRRCAEAACLCANPAARQVTCGTSAIPGNLGNLHSQLY